MITGEKNYLEAQLINYLSSFFPKLVLISEQLAIIQLPVSLRLCGEDIKQVSTLKFLRQAQVSFENKIHI
ncbi:MAG: hypothetical protein ACRDBG_06265 [Waterburya sp.]